MTEVDHNTVTGEPGNKAGQSDSAKKKSLGSGATVGLVIGIFAMLIVFVVLAFVYGKYRHRSHYHVSQARIESGFTS